MLAKSRRTFGIMKKENVILIIVSYIFSIVTFIVIIGCNDKPYNYPENPERALISQAPPKPNFYEPIDYVKWLNALYSKGKAKGANSVYDNFWRYNDEERMPDPPEDVKDALLKLSTGPTWKLGEYPKTEKYMQNTREYILIFKECVSRPDYACKIIPDPSYPENPSLAAGPWLISGKYAVLILLSEAWKTGPDQFVRMLNAWRIGLKHVCHLENANGMFQIKRACEIRSIIYQSIQNALSEKIIQQKDIDSIYKMLLDFNVNPDKEFTTIVISSWAGALGFIQGIYPKLKLNVELANMFYPINLEQLKSSKISPEEVICHIDNYYIDYFNATANNLNIKVIEDIKCIENKIDKSVLRQYPLRDFLFLKLHKILLIKLREIAEFRSLCLTIKLYDHYYKNKFWPKNLTVLNIRNNSECLIDPFSDQEFVYRLHDESFILYSVGIDEENK